MNDELKIALERIEKIKAELPIYQEILQFYEKIIKERDDYKKILRSNLKPIKIDERLAEIKLREGFPLIEKKELQFDYDIMKKYFLALLSIVKERVQAEANQIEIKIEKGEASFKEMVIMALQEKDSRDDDILLAFLLNETINPVLEIYASWLKGKEGEGIWMNGYCPICGSKPLMGVLRGEEGKRYLICSSCAGEWYFPRIQCPFCGNSEQKQLSYFCVDDDERYRVEICEACKKYIKIIDLRKIDHDVSFDIENLATLHLDIVAREKAYTSDVLTLNTYIV